MLYQHKKDTGPWKKNWYNTTFLHQFFMNEVWVKELLFAKMCDTAGQCGAPRLTLRALQVERVCRLFCLMQFSLRGISVRTISLVCCRSRHLEQILHYFAFISSSFHGNKSRGTSVSTGDLNNAVCWHIDWNTALFCLINDSMQIHTGTVNFW